MPRRPRLELPDGLYHVTARGVRQLEIFRTDSDYDCFLELLAGVTARHRWACHSYCLMPNHFHLIVETESGELSAGMWRLNGTYAKAFNRRYALEGHVFDARFHAVHVESDVHLLELTRYVVLNPVRARLCRHPAEWRWSSYGAALGATAPPPFLTLDEVLGLFGSTRDRAREAYRRFVQHATVA